MSHQNYNYSNQSQDSTLPLNNNGYSQQQYQQQYKEDPYPSNNNNGRGQGVNPAQSKKSSNKKKWLTWGIIAFIVLACIIIACVVGGVVGSRNHRHHDKNTQTNAESTKSSGSGDSNHKKGGSHGSNTNNNDYAVSAGALYPSSTDVSSNPIYPTPTKTSSGEFIQPTGSVQDTQNMQVCDKDPYNFNNNIRGEHPLLIAPKFQWDCLKSNIKSDPYLQDWNASIFSLAESKAKEQPHSYDEDGGLSGSGVLDIARELKLRIRSYAYAYQMSGDVSWVNRTWTELQVAAGNTSQPYGPAGDNWNSLHFLDTAEYTYAFAIAYDWMYDAWSADQKNAIMWSILNLGISKGLQAYSTGSGWWSNENGNWNCVCNNGLIAGSLAIMNDDTTGNANKMYNQAMGNLKTHCINAVYDDGVWTETPNYWYFGTYAMAEAITNIITATGSDQGLLSANPSLDKTGLFHMWTMGNMGLFSYGDHGPNKYTATANMLLFLGRHFDTPLYTLYQRDRADAGDPNGMFYYNPQHAGSWWDGLALDHWFNQSINQLVGFRSTWSDVNGLYFAMKASQLQGHQTHGDLDAGDFVFDAMGQRWAGELGSANYLSPGYFSSEAQDSQRWLYYRKRTEGQNTIVINGQNQLVTGSPANSRFETTGESQDAISYSPPNSSTAYFVTDLSSFYASSSVKRGVRLLNGRKQVLIQDEINANADFQWRFHTNATVEANGNTAKLSQNGKTVNIKILSPSSATFYTQPAEAMKSDPNPPEANQPNPGVTVVTVGLSAGNYSLQVLFNPQWDGMNDNDFVTPPSVALDNWSLTSHN